MNCSCISLSAPSKNASISFVVGILRVEFSTLFSIELGGLLLEPGVLMASGFLIKLHGVDSRVLLSQKERSKNVKRRLLVITVKSGFQVLLDYETQTCIIFKS